MFRVISQEEDLGGLATEEMNEEDQMVEQQQQQQREQSTSDDNKNSNSSQQKLPAFVATDDPMEIQGEGKDENVPVSVIGGEVARGEKAGYNSSSSSLSGDDDDEEDGEGDTNMLVTLQQVEDEAPLRRKQTLHRLHSSESASTTRSGRAQSSQNSSRDWGWFEDVHLSENKKSNPSKKGASVKKVAKEAENDASAMAVTAPTYVLEESLSSQRLWKESAGQRPPQPVEERAFYEKMWAQNFARSKVNYSMPVEVLTASSPISLNPFADGNFENTTEYPCPAPNDHATGNDVAEAALVHRMNEEVMHSAAVVNKKVVDSTDGEELTIVVRGDNVFGTTVSKSFARTNENGDPIPGSVDTINISIASYRVVESKHHGKYAQFLVIYREGSIRDTVGIWKRYSDFEELAHKVTQAHDSCAAAFANISPLSVAEEPETEHLPNAITSWRLLKKRKRWYRCLDAGYLSLKVFLLERFLHDILFESTSPQLLRDFVGVDTSDMF